MKKFRTHILFQSIILILLCAMTFFTVVFAKPIESYNTPNTTIEDTDKQSECEVTADIHYAYYVSLPATLTLEVHPDTADFVCYYKVKAKSLVSGLGENNLMVTPTLETIDGVKQPKLIELIDTNDVNNKAICSIKQNKYIFGDINSVDVERINSTEWASIYGLCSAKITKNGSYKGNFEFVYGLINATETPSLLNTLNSKYYLSMEDTRKASKATHEHNYVEGTCTVCHDRLPDLTVTAEGYSGIYDGNPHSIAVDSEGNIIEYSTDNISFSFVNPSYTDAGNYTVYYKVTKAGYKTVMGSQTVVIDKADGNIVAPTSKSLLENGNAQVLVGAGSSSTGTVQYKVGSTGTYSNTLPTGIYTNEYVIYYKSVGDKNHKDTVEQSITSEIKYDTNRALIFSSDDDFTLSVATSGWDGTLEYTVDNGHNWNTWDGSQLSGTATQPVYLRGIENTVITGVPHYDDNWREYPTWLDITGSDVECHGNIENLLDYRTVANGQHPTMGECCYYNMFRNCTSLTTAPELPATTLAARCYSYMFNGCTSLATAPELPATTLADYCYSSMFYNCTKLTTAPVLPATTLSKWCYYGMFKSCTSLTTVFALPATTLAENCYSYMFENCTSLVVAPRLLATTLAESCCYYMFYGCKQLAIVPELPATTLAGNCYNSMFSSCTSLITAPSLPATTLAKSCYNCMFINCTSLTTAPVLPATTLADKCYYGMFMSCTSLTTAPKLSAATLATECYRNMFVGCTSLTTAPELPATTLADYCYSSMFYSCTKLTTAPILPATTLPSGCYYEMFCNCSSLKLSKTKTGIYQYAYRIPMTGTGTTVSNALANMFGYTGGTFTGTPTINTTYYTTKPPVK